MPNQPYWQGGKRFQKNDPGQNPFDPDTDPQEYTKWQFDHGGDDTQVANSDDFSYGKLAMILAAMAAPIPDAGAGGAEGVGGWATGSAPSIVAGTSTVAPSVVGLGVGDGIGGLSPAAGEAGFVGPVAPAVTSVAAPTAAAAAPTAVGGATTAVAGGSTGAATVAKALRDGGDTTTAADGTDTLTSLPSGDIQKSVDTNQYGGQPGGGSGGGSGWGTAAKGAFGQNGWGSALLNAGAGIAGGIQNANQFSQGLAEKQREFNANLAQDQASLAQNQKQFDATQGQIQGTNALTASQDDPFKQAKSREGQALLASLLSGGSLKGALPSLGSIGAFVSPEAMQGNEAAFAQNAGAATGGKYASPTATQAGYNAYQSPLSAMLAKMKGGQ